MLQYLLWISDCSDIYDIIQLRLTENIRNKNMNCPYLRHIVFTKINQLENREQQDVEATVDQKEPHSCEDEA